MPLLFPGRGLDMREQEKTQFLKHEFNSRKEVFQTRLAWPLKCSIYSYIHSVFPEPL